MGGGRGRRHLPRGRRAGSGEDARPRLCRRAQRHRADRDQRRRRERSGRGAAAVPGRIHRCFGAPGRGEEAMSDGKTFKEAYATLQKHAQTLRSQQEPDIDNLTTIVSESVEAYKVCKERIDAVEKALEQALGNAQIEGGSE